MRSARPTIYSVLIAVLLAVPGLALAQTSPVRDETLLREYNLPIKGYVDSGTPITVSGSSCRGFGDLWDRSANPSATGGSCACTDASSCANVGTQQQPEYYPVMHSSGYATFRVQVPQAGLYKLEITTANPGDSAFFYASDAQEAQIWERWMGQNQSNLPAAFGGVWAAAERQQALRNYITQVWVDDPTDAVGPQARGFIFTPTKEAGNDQSGFVAVSLQAGEQDIILSLYNDLSHTGPETGDACLSGDYSQITTKRLANGSPACSFDRNVVYRTVRLTKSTETLDVIGIQIYTNRENLDPRVWYQRRVINAAAGVTPIVVDGYQGVKEGDHTAYINAANVEITDDTANQEAGIYKGAFYTNIYKISFNVNSTAPTTKQIYDLMLQNWEFNTNLPETDPIKREEEKNKLRRDTLRLAHVRAMREAIEAYKQRTGAYPRLQSGTFVTGHAVSTWPSWSSALGRELGISLPQDPLNALVAQDQPATAYSCSRTEQGALLDPLAQTACGAAAGEEAVVCSRDDAGRALTACPAGQQCSGQGCSICPVGSDPQTCWNSTARTFALPQTFSGCGGAYDGAFTLGASACTAPGYTYDGAYVYQYTAINNGLSYLLNYRLEWRSTTTCAADQCYYGGTCYAPGACLAADYPELKNTVCVLGQWVQSCGDGFVQTQCGEACDTVATDPAQSYCDQTYGDRPWYTEGTIAGRCTPQCTLEGIDQQTPPPAYSSDPNAPSCGGYCGDFNVQSRFGEQCDLGNASAPLKSAQAGGSGGVAEDSQYVCTGGGSPTPIDALANGGFEGGTIVAQVDAGFPGLAGDWTQSPRIQTASGNYQELPAAQPDNTWIAYSGCRSGQDSDCAGYADSALTGKRWVAYDTLYGGGVSAADRTVYYTGAGNPASLNNGGQPLLAEITSGTARSGSQSVRLLDTGPKETALWMTTAVNSIVPDTGYDLSLFLRLDAQHYWGVDRGNPEVFVGVAFFDAAGTILNQDTGTGALAPWRFAVGQDGTVGISLADISANDWTPVRLRLHSPLNASRARIVIKSDYYYRGAAFFIDDVSLATAAGCRTTGGWCGDGVTQSQYGEQCDTRAYIPPRPTETVNLLKNASFDGVFAPWTASVQQAMRLASERAYFGSHSVYVDTNPLDLAADQVPVYPIVISQRSVQLFPGTAYTASVAISHDTGSIAQVSLRYGSAEGSVTQQLQPASTGSAGWERYSASFTPSITADSVAFVITYPLGEAPALYLDDAEIIPQRGAQAAIPQYRCGTDRGALCQYTGGYCGDGVAQSQYGEQCDDAVGRSCTSDAQCGATGTGKCTAGICTSSACNQYCAGSFCGDGIVQRAGNSQGVKEICDTKGDPTCSYDCRLRVLGGQCQGDFAATGDGDRCAPGLTCAIRNYGDTTKVCLGTLGSYGCRSNNDCALGYYCDARKAKCEPEVRTYTQYHGAESDGRSYTLPGTVAPYPLTYAIYGTQCPDVRTVQSGDQVYKLDRCTGLVWGGTDEITRDTWTHTEATTDACGGVFRLPTADELYSLVRQGSAAAPFTDKEGLKLCCASCGYSESEADLCQDSATDDNYIYWTDTCVDRDATGACVKALAVNFKYGGIEEHPVTDSAKIRCVKQTACGNGQLEEGEQCEFYSVFTSAQTTCTAASDCSEGQICRDGQCGTIRLLEQPIAAACSDRGWDGGALHCDPQTCLLREDNCVLASKPGLTCDQICAQKDPGLTCASVGTDLFKSSTGAAGTGEYYDISSQEYLIARDAAMYTADASGGGTQCLVTPVPQGFGSACAYPFIAQSGTCTIPGAAGGQVPAPYSPQYSYCNCTQK